MSLRLSRSTLFFAIILLAAACSGTVTITATPPAPTMTLQGAIVPTRAIPTGGPPTVIPEPRAASDPLFPVTIGASLALGGRVTGTIEGQEYATAHTFSGLADQTITISMQAISGDLDPFITLLAPDGRELARNDDESAGSADAAINGLTLPQSGEYTIIATRFQQRFGPSAGNFVLSVSLADEGSPTNVIPSQAMDYGTSKLDFMGTDINGFTYTFAGAAGDVVNIQMTALNGDIDPMVILTDSFGNELARNDDDFVLHTLDSSIRNLRLPVDGFYSIVAQRSLPTIGLTSGDVLVELLLDEAATAASANQQLAILDGSNSGSLDADGARSNGYRMGDVVNDRGEDVAIQTLLTFYLPPSNSQSINSALLQFGPCVETGLGFSGLGPLNVHLDAYGRFDADSSQSLSANAETLTTLTSCAEAEEGVDILEAVLAAYQTTEAIIQLRFTFSGTLPNGELDNIVWGDPRIIIATE